MMDTFTESFVRSTSLDWDVCRHGSLATIVRCATELCPKKISNFCPIQSCVTLIRMNIPNVCDPAQDSTYDQG